MKADIIGKLTIVKESAKETQDNGICKFNINLFIFRVPSKKGKRLDTSDGDNKRCGIWRSEAKKLYVA
jgi:hypothetical protein